MITSEPTERMTVTIGLVVPIRVGHAWQVRDPVHPTAIAVQQAEKRHKASVVKEAADREALEVARGARDKAILEDPDTDEDEIIAEDIATWIAILLHRYNREWLRSFKDCDVEVFSPGELQLRGEVACPFCLRGPDGPELVTTVDDPAQEP